MQPLTALNNPPDIKVPPQEEPNPAMREEFCGIDRIPYCTLEVMINGQPHYVSGKHFKLKDGEPEVGLTAECYAD